MALVPLTFTSGEITAADDAIIYNDILKTGIYGNIGDKLDFSNAGTLFTIQNGYFSILGRQGKIINTESVDVDVPANNSFGYIILKIDLNEPAGNQLSITFKLNPLNLPQLIQEDLNNGGEIYEMPICSFEISSGGAVSNVEDQRTYANNELVFKTNTIGLNFIEIDIPKNWVSFTIGAKINSGELQALALIGKNEGGGDYGFDFHQRIDRDGSTVETEQAAGIAAICIGHCSLPTSIKVLSLRIILSSLISKIITSTTISQYSTSAISFSFF